MKLLRPISPFAAPRSTAAALARPCTALATALAAALCLGLPARADSLLAATSSAGSSASSAGSASSHGSSDAISGISGSGDDKTAHIATGDYRLTAVAPAQDKPDTLRLSLAQPAPASAAAAPAFLLDVPATAFGAQPPQAGELIQVQRHSYGLQFARGPAAAPFFLVLNNATLRELAAQGL